MFIFRYCDCGVIVTTGGMNILLWIITTGNRMLSVITDGFVGSIYMKVSMSLCTSLP